MADQLTIYSWMWPQEFLAEYERIGEAVWFFLYLLTRQNPENGYVRGSFTRMAGELGVSMVMLKQWLERLEYEGYVKDESLDGRMVVRVEE